MSAKLESWGALSPIIFTACAQAVDLEGDMASRNAERFDAGAVDSAAGPATGGGLAAYGTGGTPNTGGASSTGGTPSTGGVDSTGGVGDGGGSAGATGGSAGTTGIDAAPPPGASCDNGIADGLETDTDCGGEACPPCGEGATCDFDADCASRQCRASVCEAAACVAMASCECVDSGSQFYQLCTESKTFTAAQTACQSAGMSLVRIDDAGENGLLRTEGNARGLGDFWIGGTDSGAEGTWKWPDGTTFWTGAATGSAIGYANWSSGEPNDLFDQDCAVLVGSGKWDDAACTDSRKFACE